MARRILTILGFLSSLLGIACTLSAQHTPVNIINGAQNPELIPDAVAQRLYIASLAENNDYVRGLRVARLRLDAPQAAIFNEVITDFDALQKSGTTTSDVDAHIANSLLRLDQKSKSKLQRVLQSERYGMQVSVNDSALAKVRNRNQLMPVAFHPAHPQGGGIQMGPPAYSVYQPDGTTDGIYAYVQVITSGDAPNCYSPAGLCSQPAHTLSATLYVGGSNQYGGVSYSQMIAPLTYGQVSEQVAVPVSFIAHTPTPTIGEGRVQCRFIGPYFYAASLSNYLEYAVTVVQTTTPQYPPLGGPWSVTSYCGTNWRPPDYQPSLVGFAGELPSDWRPFWSMSTTCVRFGSHGSWHCAGPPIGLWQAADSEPPISANEPFCDSNP
jgi:hypothetical protein